MFLRKAHGVFIKFYHSLVTNVKEYQVARVLYHRGIKRPFHVSLCVAVQPPTCLEMYCIPQRFRIGKEITLEVNDSKSVSCEKLGDMAKLTVHLEVKEYFLKEYFKKKNIVNTNSL